jgi:hypothetical protein
VAGHAPRRDLPQPAAAQVLEQARATCRGTARHLAVGQVTAHAMSEIGALPSDDTAALDAHNDRKES